MSNTRVPNLQLRSTESTNYGDTTTPSLANYQTNTVDLEDDLNNLRSQINNFLRRSGAALPGAGGWYTDIQAPTTFGTDVGGSTTIRGINPLNNDLWGIQRKRILKRVPMVDVDVPDPGAAQVVILAAGDIPSTTTAAVGVVTTLGTVVAEATLFGTAGLDEVAGANPLQPKNLLTLTDTTTGQFVTGVVSGQQIYGLLQSEFAADGNTITGTTPNRVQISFVKRNAANSDLELATVGDMNGIVFDYAFVRRDAFEDCPEESWLEDGFADSGANNVDLQTAYDNQSTTPVATLSNAILDLGAGFLWEIGDTTSAALFTVTEGSAGGTTTLAVGAGVDVYTNSAVDVNFTNGITVAEAGNDINIGVTGSQIDFTSAATITNTSGNGITIGTTSANLNLTTTTGGAVDISAVGNVTIDSSIGSLSMGADANGGAINIGTGAAPRTITVGNSTGGTAIAINSGSGAISLTSLAGAVNVSSASGGAASSPVSLTAGPGSASAGNNVSLTSGAGDGATNNGGNITLLTSVGVTSGDSGSASINTGAANATSGSNSGAIQIRTGDNGVVAGSSSGAISIRTGSGDSGGDSVGSSGDILLVSGHVGGATIKAGQVSLTSGGITGASTGAAGDILLTQGDSNAASGDFAGGVGEIALTASSNAGTATAGAVTLTAGGNTNGVSGAAGAISLIGGSSTSGQGSIIVLQAGLGVTDGYVHLDSGVGAADIMLRLDAAGAGGAIADMYVGSTVPAHTARGGSLFLFNDGATANTGGRLYTQVDGGTGTDWRQIVTATGAARQFAQVIVNTTITGAAVQSGTTNLTQAKCSTGTMPTRIAGHDFNTQSEIYFNGVMMMNGTNNEVAVATVGDTDVDIFLQTGANLTTNDVVTIVYYNF